MQGVVDGAWILRLLVGCVCHTFGLVTLVDVIGAENCPNRLGFPGLEWFAVREGSGKRESL